MTTPQKLQLQRPIVFFDLETTGLDIATDRIIEMAFLKVYPDGREETLHTLVNPGIPIPASSTQVHGITDEMVQSAPPFSQVGKEVAKFLVDCDLGGYNCLRFDLPMLAEEFHRAEIMMDLKSNRKIVDAQVIFHKKEQRTLSAAYQFYCDAELTDAHSADADTRATYEVLLGQLQKYADLPTDIDGLSAYTTNAGFVDFSNRLIRNEKGIICFNFGKHRGEPVEHIIRTNPGYYDWMMQADFPRDTKYELTKIYIQMRDKQ